MPPLKEPQLRDRPDKRLARQVQELSSSRSDLINQSTSCCRNNNQAKKVIQTSIDKQIIINDGDRTSRTMQHGDEYVYWRSRRYCANSRASVESSKSSLSFCPSNGLNKLKFLSRRSNDSAETHKIRSSFSPLSVFLISCFACLLVAPATTTALGEPTGDTSIDISKYKSNLINSDTAAAKELLLAHSRTAQGQPRQTSGVNNNNITDNVFENLLRKKPYSKYLTVEQKWDDLFKRLLALQGPLAQMATRSLLRDVEYYADLSISRQCEEDIKFVQGYLKQSTNFRWLTHMIDATGKSEPGMLTGNLAQLGHVVQCVRTRAPTRPSNHSFDERYFDYQTEILGERFRGKYCLVSIRPVLPTRPKLISRFSNDLFNDSLLFNISYAGEPVGSLKLRTKQMTVPKSDLSSITKQRIVLGEVPFESELYQHLLFQRNFMFSLPNFQGVCFPSSCTKDDVRLSIQKTLDEQHQVADVEFECEQEELSTWDWFSMPRLLAYVLLFLVATLTVGSSLARYILVDKLRFKRSKLNTNSSMFNLLEALELLSLDKCAGILFVKTRQASSIVDSDKVENNRSTSIDALKGFLVLVLVYSQLAVLGCLPVPFMWSKWADAMFPFYRAPLTQMFLNMAIWTEAFYMISAYLITLKVLVNARLTEYNRASTSLLPSFTSFAGTRYVRLVMPMVAFVLLNYVWPRLSNGFVMQDQANKLMTPCDKYGWSNILLFHNRHNLNETCLWPSHVSATFFQLHLLSYPILFALVHSKVTAESKATQRKWLGKALQYSTLATIGLIATLGLVYPALVASQQELIVPFLIDYIDFDNYKAVIEWTVLPVHNHLTSYMFGIILALIVVSKQTLRQPESRPTSKNEWFGHYSHRQASPDSVGSSSTQELQDELHFENISKKYSLSMEPQEAIIGRMSNGTPQRSSKPGWLSWIIETLKSLIALLIMLTALSASWLWNGLGQPMSAEQTYWYVCGTKFFFCSSFAYLFYRHVATRKNSNNPYIVTRFLVPIGRMSLMVFYMSWLVTWFDLLSSPHQWHPSHYFIFEKFCEIIFATLLASMIAYGSFEGTIKRVQYAKRAEQLKLDRVQQQVAPSGKQQLSRRQRVKAFESFFLPPVSEQADGNKLAGEQRNNLVDNATTAEGSTSWPTGANLAQQPKLCLPVPDGARYLSGTSNNKRLKSQPTRAHLTTADQCKLNAELRANYSFASIGLYESAGATGDLSQLSDPQASPAPSQRRS